MYERKFEWSERVGGRSCAEKINLGNAMRTFDKKREREEEQEKPHYVKRTGRRRVERRGESAETRT